MTTEERLRSLLEAATPGPWRVESADDPDSYLAGMAVEAVNALPKLLAVVAAARTLLAEADQVTGRLIGVPRRDVEALVAALAALDEEGKR